ncbi:hypothetical protein AYI68_g7607 [Smittium mucronatum]|uniref:Uncharacterized protein n=1 Tax=Smittium mucronatum TaxID=133383 RepID=A0A1R0GN75_9FUNG|nr:hypothetical protein AYI68_g7607 [Smittium mucronatum]
MSEDTNTKLNKLTSLVSQLIRKREHQIYVEDLFITLRIPLTKITVYKELSQVISVDHKGLFPNLSIERRSREGTIHESKNQLYELLSTATEQSSFKIGEQVGYHAAPNSEDARLSHTTYRLIRKLKYSGKSRDHNHRIP